MDYKKQLDNLRSQVFAAKPVTTAPAKSGGFVQPRTVKFDSLKDTPMEQDDPLAFATEWLRKIKTAAMNNKDKTTPTAEGGLAQGIVKGLVNKGPKPEPVSLISRPLSEGETLESSGRREHLPSDYAPRNSKAGSFLDIMDKHEGGGNYDTLFGHSQKGRFNIKVSERTIGELLDFSKTSGEYGQWVKEELRRAGHKPRVATPMGRYQFVGTTMREVADEMGLSHDTVFDRNTQDAMFNHYLGKKIRSAKTIEGKIAAVRAGWEGFKSVPSTTLADLIMKYEDA